LVRGVQAKVPKENGCKTRAGSIEMGKQAVLKESDIYS
jgi:hypothetical protein